ncbi:hypothetical protein JW905_16300, partial [bacterium]|nr:hypothetical protein [candidate division CSSED10-310 bacterium]
MTDGDRCPWGMFDGNNQTRRSWLPLWLLVALIAVGTVPAGAAWVSDPAVNMKFYQTSADTEGHRIIPDGAGGYIMVWHNYDAVTDSDVFAQRIDSSGNLLWGVDGLAVCAEEAAQCYPKVCSDGSGGIFIFWQDQRTSPANQWQEMFGQHVSAAGALLWDPAGVQFTEMEVWLYCPYTVPDGAGGCYLIYDGGTNGCFCKRIDSSGSEVWASPVQVGAGLGWTSLKSEVDGEGGVYLTWVEERGSTSRDVYVQRLDSSGTLQWGAGGLCICAAADYQECSRLMYNTVAGGAFFMWKDHRDSSNNQVFIQKVSAAGGVNW